jgi:hypothetical protein
MKTQLIQDEPDPAVGTPTARPQAPPPSRTPSGTWPMVWGAVILLVAVSLLVGGAATLRALAHRDSGGYLMTGTHRIATPANGLVSERLDIGSDWPFAGDVATGRVEARSSQPVFVGIGRSDDVDRYVAGFAHTEITDIDTDPFRLTSHVVPGSAQAGAPGQQSFWRVKASGAGVQAVKWPVEAGQWSVVIMNADGSPRVDVQTRLGVRVPAARWAGIGLLVVGGLVLIPGALLVRRGYQRRTA